jgi:hypothetical protein
MTLPEPSHGKSVGMPVAVVNDNAQLRGLGTNSLWQSLHLHQRGYTEGGVLPALASGELTGCEQWSLCEMAQK